MHGPMNVKIYVISISKQAACHFELRWD